MKGNTVTQEELSVAIPKHEKWLESHGREGQQADFSEQTMRGLTFRKEDPYADVDLSRAILKDATLTKADLRGAKLLEADLSGADLSEARLGASNLTRANLRKASLFRANLWWANLRGADLERTELLYTSMVLAEVTGARLEMTTAAMGNPIDLLQADWGDLRDETNTKMMRLNASAISLGEQRYSAWATGGPYPCGRKWPYLGTPSRVVNFLEKRQLWSRGPVLSLWDALSELLDEKCGDDPYELPQESITVGELRKAAANLSEELTWPFSKMTAGDGAFPDDEIVELRIDGAVYSSVRKGWLVHPSQVIEEEAAQWLQCLSEGGLLPKESA